MSRSDPSDYGPDRFGQLLGLEVLEAGPERVRARLQVDARHHQPYGIVHGGVYCAIVEDVASRGAGIALRAAAEAGEAEGVGVVGVANATDFLRSTSEGELVAEGRPVYTGRNVALWEVEIRRSSDDALVARGQVRFHVLRETPATRRSGSR